jgi:hypothetical protein
MEELDIMDVISIKNQLDRECESLAKDLFKHIDEEGESIFDEGMPLHNLKDSPLLDILIRRFEENEEYEKCLRLLNIKKEVSISK